jgi:hypothetical protein
MERYKITVEEITTDEVILIGSFDCGPEQLDAIKAIRDAATGITATQTKGVTTTAIDAGQF